MLRYVLFFHQIKIDSESIFLKFKVQSSNRKIRRAFRKPVEVVD